MNKIALGIHVSVDDWTAERAIIASNFYRPQRSCGKVMFLHLSAILFTWGVCIRACTMEDTRPGQTPPPPWADTPLAEIPQADTPPQQTATAADGTHPTGMYSCLVYFYNTYVHRCAKHWRV